MVTAPLANLEVLVVLDPERLVAVPRALEVRLPTLMVLPGFFFGLLLFFFHFVVNDI